jgi:TonB-dependent receptor
MLEKVPAGYVQAQAQVKKLTVLGGVRYEHVDMSAYTYFKRLSTTALEEPDVYKRAVRDYQKSYVPPGNYTKAFPSIHFAYDITPNLKARASWSTSYGRPTIQQLTPTPAPNDAAQTITSGNGNLKPQLAENVDLKLEYVFKSNGLVSLGYFKKTITDFISPTGTFIGEVADGPDNGYDGLYAGYDIIAFTNLGTATAEGLEFDYRQRLTFLPGLLKGLTVSANYTMLRTEGDFGTTVSRKGNDIPGFIPRTGNIRLLYNYKKFGASTSVNYTGKHIVGFSAIGSTANFYRRDLITYNVGATYRVRPNVTAYVDVVNITEEGPERYIYTESRTRAVWNGAMTVSVGVSGQF